MKTNIPVLSLLFLALAPISPGAIVTGSAVEFASNVLHPNQSIYDVVLMTGTAAAVKCDPGERIRVAFVDLNGDILQAEFWGAGSLTIELAAASGPAPAKKYNQPNVAYMTGHASFTISGSDATTNFGVLSVGKNWAVNPTLFRPDESYDGIADIQRLTIVANPAGPGGTKFGFIHLFNVHFWGTSGVVGINAANVDVQGGDFAYAKPVTIGDLSAIGDANPVLSFGVNSQFGSVIVWGGDLSQPNGKPIEASGYAYPVLTQETTTSNGVLLPEQSVRAELSRNGIVQSIVSNHYDPPPPLPPSVVIVIGGSEEGR